MKNMKLLLAILAIALVFGMTSCGRPGPGPGGDDGINPGSTGGNGLFTIRAIAFGGGKFVAGGSAQAGEADYRDTVKMAYSTNGTSWTYGNCSDIFGSNSTTNVTAIAYGNSKFVAVGVTGKMATSSDGITWTEVTTSTFGSNAINAIAFGGDKFVAGSKYGTMATSSDGVTWTAVTASPNIPSTINAIAYGGGKFVAVGNGMATSTNGTEWTKVTPSAIDSTINAIAYGGDKFVAGGDRGKMATSPDGTTWTAINIGTLLDYKHTSGATQQADIYAIAYGGGKFYAGGGSGSSSDSQSLGGGNSVGKCISSTNGSAWTAAANSSTFATITIRAIAFGDGKFVVCGDLRKIWAGN